MKIANDFSLIPNRDCWCVVRARGVWVCVPSLALSDAFSLFISWQSEQEAQERPPDTINPHPNTLQSDVEKCNCCCMAFLINIFLLATVRTPNFYYIYMYSVLFNRCPQTVWLQVNSSRLWWKKKKRFPLYVFAMHTKRWWLKVNAFVVIALFLRAQFNIN